MDRQSIIVLVLMLIIAAALVVALIYRKKKKSFDEFALASQSKGASRDYLKFI